MEAVILKIATALEGFFHSKFVSVFFVSMFPVVEVRGGIPLGLSMGMNPGISYLAAITAGLVVSPIILFLLKKIIMLLCKSKHLGKFGVALNRYFNAKAEKVKEGKIIQKRDKDIYKYLALFAFVAAPLPLTGFWTGSAIAVFLGLNFWKSFLTITLGNLTAGGIILLLSLVLGDKAYIITIIFAVLLPVMIILVIVKMVLDSKKRKAQLAMENASNDSAQPTEENSEKEVPEENLETKENTNLDNQEFDVVEGGKEKTNSDNQNPNVVEAGKENTTIDTTKENTETPQIEGELDKKDD